ncbi:hypothetical protein [Microbacterium aurum]
MAAQSGPVNDARATVPDVQLQGMIAELDHAEHQGVPLRPRDYILLALLTIAVPIILTVWGVAVA